MDFPEKFANFVSRLFFCIDLIIQLQDYEESAIDIDVDDVAVVVP
jgi:hypothetical protein